MTVFLFHCSKHQDAVRRHELPQARFCLRSWLDTGSGWWKYRFPCEHEEFWARYVDCTCNHHLSQVSNIALVTCRLSQVSKQAYTDQWNGRIGYFLHRNRQGFWTRYVDRTCNAPYVTSKWVNRNGLTCGTCYFANCDSQMNVCFILSLLISG